MNLKKYCNVSSTYNCPRSSESLQSGTLNCTEFDCPEMLTESATTETSQKSVSLSSGSRPLASSRRKSRRMNFLKPQSLPCQTKNRIRIFQNGIIFLLMRKYVKLHKNKKETNRLVIRKEKDPSAEKRNLSWAMTVERE